jgi:membrane associated rhomboid family serine protease
MKLSQWLPADVSWRELLANLSAYDLFTFAYGYRPAHPSVLALFTAMFLHSGFLHLAGNMLFLWVLAIMLRIRWGT